MAFSGLVRTLTGMTDLTDLAPLLERQFLRHGRETPIKGLLLNRAEGPSGIIRSVYGPSFCLVVQGAKLSTLGPDTYRYRAGECLIASVDVPVSARIVAASPAEPYLALSFALPPEDVTALVAEAEIAPAPAAPFAALAAGRADPSLCDPIRRLLECLDHPRDRSVLVPLIRRELVWRLLHSSLGAALAQMGARDSHGARVGRACAHIRAHYAQSLRVQDLARLAGMSVPSFHRHFKAVTTMTPVQFQKLVRLQEARRRLMSAEEVASVGYAIGYESPSQFSRDYRRLFGHPPGRDGAAIRARFAPEPALP